MKPTQNDVDMLKKEIDVIQKKYSPQSITIITWGKTAKNAINKTNLTKTSVISIPHPGKQNWNNWKLRIFEKAIYQGNPSYATNSYPTKKRSTSCEIVSKEALSEIFSQIPIIRKI